LQLDHSARRALRNAGVLVIRPMNLGFPPQWDMRPGLGSRSVRELVWVLLEDQLCASAPNTSMPYTDTEVVDGTSYCYATTAVNSSNQESGYSNIVSTLRFLFLKCKWKTGVRSRIGRWYCRMRTFQFFPGRLRDWPGTTKPNRFQKSRGVKRNPCGSPSSVPDPTI
jgi:hypothetical protein